VVATVAVAPAKPEVVEGAPARATTARAGAVRVEAVAVANHIRVSPFSSKMANL